MVDNELSRLTRSLCLSRLSRPVSDVTGESDIDNDDDGGDDDGGGGDGETLGMSGIKGRQEVCSRFLAFCFGVDVNRVESLLVYEGLLHTDDDGIIVDDDDGVDGDGEALEIPGIKSLLECGGLLQTEPRGETRGETETPESHESFLLRSGHVLTLTSGQVFILTSGDVFIVTFPLVFILTSGHVLTSEDVLMLTSGEVLTLTSGKVITLTEEAGLSSVFILTSGHVLTSGRVLTLTSGQVLTLTEEAGLSSCFFAGAGLPDGDFSALNL